MFCFTNLDEALFETDIVVEAINEELEDKRQLLESKCAAILISRVF